MTAQFCHNVSRPSTNNYMIPAQIKSSL